MAPPRSRAFYLATFGEEEGNKQYERLIVERELREKRKAGGKSLTAVVDLSTPEAQQAAIDAGNALRCLECGYVGTRLQHTHFKHKCSGKVKNGEEYKKLHPGALVVSPNLAKNTSGNITNYIKLHGEEEGKKRWEVYKGKQADSNGLEYKQEKHGWTKEQFDAYNASRASTKENFVKRHGEQDGTIKWEQYVERQRETINKRYFIETYNEIEGAAKYNAFNIARGLSSGSNQSKLEFECFKWFSQVCPSLQHRFDVITDTHGHPFDFGCGEKKKLVELHGTYWHADPVVYGEEGIDQRFTKEHVQWIRQNDAAKVKAGNDAGYDVIVIWEREWKTNRREVVNKLYNWWEAPNPYAKPEVVQPPIVLSQQPASTIISTNTTNVEYEDDFEWN